MAHAELLPSAACRLLTRDTSRCGLSNLSGCDLAQSSRSGSGLVYNTTCQLSDTPRSSAALGGSADLRMNSLDYRYKPEAAVQCPNALPESGYRHDPEA